MNERSYSNPFVVVAEASPTDRSRFVRRTYAHLAAAILAFVALEAILLNSTIAPILIKSMVGSQYSWLIVLALFMGVSWVAEYWANSGASRLLQYAGLGLYVLAQAIIFIPI